MSGCEIGTVVVVGATGAVGREVLLVLEGRGTPAMRVRAVASERSAGQVLAYGRDTLRVEPLHTGVFAGAEVVIFAADARTSREYAGIAVRSGALVVDNSSAFRLEAGVPLIVPEVNGGELARGGTRVRGGLIANPNCSTAILLMAVEPLRRAFGLARITVATYQAVSGAGIAAMEELREQTRGVLAGEAARPGVFREPCAFNLFSHDSEVDPETGANGEEQKIIDEARKITGDAGLRVTATCVRVPVARAHSQAIVVEVERACREEDVRGAYEGFAGVRVVDDRARNSFPTPLKATGRDEVLVGRIRPDPAAPKDERGRTRGWCLFASGDQLRKGAALNAVQIAELAGVRLRGSQAAA